MRALIAFLAFLIVATTSAGAADNAERAVIGFSPDGRYFAFEQYGVQDGSGFPYSEIFVVDLDANQWVKGSPFRERVDDENALVSAARAQSAKAAQKLLTQLKAAEPGEILASQPVTESSPGRRRLTFDPFYISLGSQPASRYTLSLDLVPFTASENCHDDENAKQMGFKLTITDKDQNASKEIYKDLSIPSSRYCPRDYDIADVIAYRSSSQGDRHVALIGVYTPGFEGMDRRLIAVPFTLP